MKESKFKSYWWKKPHCENYFQPKTMEEAIQVLEAFQGESKVIAGGTDLLAQMRQGGFKVKTLLDITRLPGSDGIRLENGFLRLGILATHKQLSDFPLLRERAFCLAEAASQVGTPQIRNLGTLGGNLCNASPAADSAPPLLVLEATAKIVGKKGERDVPIGSFFIGPGQTILGPCEILKEVVIPELPEGISSTFQKLGRRKGADLALVSVAALLSLDRKEKTCRVIRIGLGSVAPTPIRAGETEKFLLGKRLDDDSIREAGQFAQRESRPISDVRGSAEYRKEMVRVLVERALRKCLGQWEEKHV
jgi:carbon-monoxide dehydrogenase medium subunit